MLNFNRHAYLIMAHNNFEQLKTLLKMLDYESNDIYLHIDLKARHCDRHELESCVQKSKIFIYRKIDVRWADYSQVECELLLFAEAGKNHYQYYHLISGMDLPLRTQCEIHKFFENNNGYEFIHFSNVELPEMIMSYVKYYHFFSKIYKIGGSITNHFIRELDAFFVQIQKMLGVDRIKGEFKVQKGANWCSITDDLVQHILSNAEWVYENFRMTKSPDEFFVQTLVINSTFSDRIYSSRFDDDYIACLRFIDWRRGTPAIFEETDFDILINSQFLFARKFDENIDNNIILKIYNHLSKKDRRIVCE